MGPAFAGPEKNSPSRVRFRPQLRVTFRFRVLAARLRFDLLASRARCKRHTTTPAEPLQGGPGTESRILRKISLARPLLDFVQDHTKTGPQPGAARL